ncbi:hypothetical protein Trydic_g23336 [Trypoxylus dichotomus]
MHALAKAEIKEVHDEGFKVLRRKLEVPVSWKKEEAEGRRSAEELTKYYVYGASWRSTHCKNELLIRPKLDIIHLQFVSGQ